MVGLSADPTPRVRVQSSGGSCGRVSILDVGEFSAPIVYMASLVRNSPSSPLVECQDRLRGLFARDPLLVVRSHLHLRLVPTTGALGLSSLPRIAVSPDWVDVASVVGDGLIHPV